MSDNTYISDTTDHISVDATSSYTTDGISWNLAVSGDEKGIHPVLYFKYIKKKFGLLERKRLDSRLKRLEKAFYKAVESGQDALGSKILNKLAVETRESVMYTKGIRHFIEYDDVMRHKRNIKGGHISDTLLKDFTRVIPKNVLKKKAKVEDCFDDFVVFHYWNDSYRDDMDADEKEKMRDPVLFGVIKENNRLYFIADWEDEYCDLTFDELVDVIGKDDDEFTLSSRPEF